MHELPALFLLCLMLAACGGGEDYESLELQCKAEAMPGTPVVEEKNEQ